MLASFPDAPGVGRDIQVLRTGVKLDGAAPAVAAPPPELGQDNEAVYGELGLGPEDLARLKQEKVI